MTWRQKRRLKRKGEDEKEREGEVDGQVSFLVRAFGSNRMAEGRRRCQQTNLQTFTGAAAAWHKNGEANAVGRTHARSVSECNQAPRTIHLESQRPPMQAALSYVVLWTYTGLGKKASARLCECCRQAQAGVVSNSTNKIHQTWPRPFSRAL